MEHPSCNWSLEQQAAVSVATHESDRERRAKEALLPFCSFPEVRSHPRQAAIEAQSRAWLVDLCSGRLPATAVQSLLDKRMDTLGCLFYPQTFSDGRSLTLVKLAHWIILLDDVMDRPQLLGHSYGAARRFACQLFKSMFGDDTATMMHAGLHVAEDGHGVLGEHSSVQQELVIEVGVQWVQEMRLLGMSRTQLQRLPEAVADYLAGILGMIYLRQEKRIPTLDEYVQLRRMDGAQQLFPLGCEFALGIELNKQILEHPLVRKLHRATSDQLLWINDLLSFKRESDEGQFYTSLLAVLQYKNQETTTAREEGDVADEGKQLDFSQALEEAYAMIKQVDQERVRLVSEIAEWMPDLAPYVQATHFTITGMNFWSLWSKRD